MSPTPAIGTQVTILASVHGRTGQIATVVPATVHMLHFPVCVRYQDGTHGYYCPSALKPYDEQEVHHDDAA